MTVELYWMTLTVLMTSLLWAPYIMDRLVVRGFVPAARADTAETGSPHSPWAQRAMRAHANAVENLAVFVAAVLVLHVLKISTPLTQWAAVIYFFARLLHFIVYTGGIPFLRPVVFTIAWLAQVALIVSALGWL
jgi:uncharacterized MAPEG superfamily protein